VLQRTLGHITLPEDAYRPRGDSGAGNDTDSDGGGGGTLAGMHAGATGRSSDVLRSIRRTVEHDAVRQSRRGVPTPLQPPVRGGGGGSNARFSTHGSWLFAPSIPSADAVAERCLEVLYQVGTAVVVFSLGFSLEPTRRTFCKESVRATVQTPVDDSQLRNSK
jgi:hypothetical protein